MPNSSLLADKLVEHIATYRRCVVAYSGGVDSAVVAKAAHLALGGNSVAVTAVSPSLASGELQSAIECASLIGIAHETIHTSEFSNPEYVRNAADRCYHCKSELYSQLDILCQRYPEAIVANGTNVDDTGDYRPGLTAASEHRVRSPLADCGCSKDDVRGIAKHWKLPVWDKPATPCLSSRVAYGEAVTPERLRMIDQAEQFLRDHGFSELRVRYHNGDLARVEVPAAEIGQLMVEPLRTEMTQRLQELGFRFVTVDARGFRSGSLNQLVQIDTGRR